LIGNKIRCEYIALEQSGEVDEGNVWSGGVLRKDQINFCGR
jgi:hypothetical protein